MSERTDTAKIERRDPRDPRVDRLTGYALQTAMTVAIAFGGWYARATGDKVETVVAQLSELRTEVAVLRANSADTAELRRELSAMRLLVGALQGEVATLRRDVDRSPR